MSNLLILSDHLDEWGRQKITTSIEDNKTILTSKIDNEKVTINLNKLPEIIVDCDKRKDNDYLKKEKPKYFNNPDAFTDPSGLFSNVEFI